MTKTQDMGAFFDELQTQGIACARAEIAAEQADPAHRARILAKIAEDEARPDPVETCGATCDECGGELDELGHCIDCEGDES